MKKLKTRWKQWGTVRRVLYSGLAAGAVLALAGTLWTGLFIAGVTGPGCPSVADLRDYRPPEATRVFAMDGSLVADLSPQRRVVLGLEDMPPMLREGMIAVEDRRFWEHSGVDLRSVGRAVVRNITGLGFREGFSTIHMQLTRNVFSRELPRSIRSGALARDSR